MEDGIANHIRCAVATNPQSRTILMGGAGLPTHSRIVLTFLRLLVKRNNPMKNSA